MSGCTTFFPLFHERQDFRKKKILNIKWVFWFSLQILSETLVILRRTERDKIISALSPHAKYPLFLTDFNETRIFSTDFRKMLTYKITETECVNCAVRSTFYVLPTQCIYVFCVDLRTNSDYFTVQHWLVGFYNWDGVCLLRGTFYILRSAHTVYLCVLCGSENKQRLFHCTALTGWFL